MTLFKLALVSLVVAAGCWRSQEEEELDGLPDNIRSPDTACYPRIPHQASELLPELVRAEGPHIFPSPDPAHFPDVYVYSQVEASEHELNMLAEQTRLCAVEYLAKFHPEGNGSVPHYGWDHYKVFILDNTGGLPFGGKIESSGEIIYPYYQIHDGAINWDPRNPYCGHPVIRHEVGHLMGQGNPLESLSIFQTCHDLEEGLRTFEQTRNPVFPPIGQGLVYIDHAELVPLAQEYSSCLAIGDTNCETHDISCCTRENSLISTVDISPDLEPLQLALARVVGAGTALLVKPAEAMEFQSLNDNHCDFVDPDIFPEELRGGVLCFWSDQAVENDGEGLSVLITTRPLLNLSYEAGEGVFSIYHSTYLGDYPVSLKSPYQLEIPFGDCSDRDRVYAQGALMWQSIHQRVGEEGYEGIVRQLDNLRWSPPGDYEINLPQFMAEAVYEETGAVVDPAELAHIMSTYLCCIQNPEGTEPVDLTSLPFSPICESYFAASASVAN